MKQKLLILISKKVEKDHFYLIHDGSRTGHPGLIFWKNDEANLYLAIKFGTTDNQNNIQLKHPISKTISKSYVYKKPLLLKRKDIGKELLNDIRINIEDFKTVEQIKNIFPSLSKSVNRKSKRLFKYLSKKKTV